MTINKNKIFLTKDGSHSIHHTKLNEHYHSDQGAISESEHVYIKNGLQQINKNEINILEIGFGTGLNALLSCLYAKHNNKKINYYTIEKYPITKQDALQLNYPEILSLNKSIFIDLHESEWNKKIQITNYFILKKIKVDLVNFDFTGFTSIDLVYYDAFSPSKQPELWEESIFSTIHNIMNNNALLTTYSSAGKVKQALRAAGFLVKRKAGAHGKFHMLNAFVNK